MAKHPHKPYPPSKTPRAEHMLDLVHSDLCGPFPIQTPHTKLYLLMFNCLPPRIKCWMHGKIVKDLWENHVECRVKVFRSDNDEEFLSMAFTKVLEEAGIEQQLAAPYTHQQNGKAEQAI